MIIKKYQAKTEAAATELAKKELGPGVVIMSVRSVKKKGLLRFLRPKRIEVTAALEEEADGRGVARKDAAAQTRQSAQIQDQTRQNVQTQTQQGAQMQQTAYAQQGAQMQQKAYAQQGAQASQTAYAQQGAQMQQKAYAQQGAQTQQTVYTQQGAQMQQKAYAQQETQAQQTAYAQQGAQMQQTTFAQQGVPTQQAVRTSDGKSIEERLENLQNLLERQLESGSDSGEQEVEEEKSETVAFIQLLYNTMIENEVNEKYANQIIDELEKSNKENTPIDYLLSNVYQKLILKFGKSLGIQPAKKGPKVIFFIGPTGVGKTTTIAKIASRFCVEEKRKIALLTADTYRIAAAEQLRTYANILETPFRVIYAVDELEQAMADFTDYDYILVDTAGHSHKNKEQQDDISRFIHSVDDKAEKEVFLVLSAATKYKDLLGIADAYRKITDYKLIFTKLDETATLGNLLNVKLYTGASVSYVTYGQNVPDDIEDFNPQKTVKQLLGGKRQEV